MPDQPITATEITERRQERAYEPGSYGAHALEGLDLLRLVIKMNAKELNEWVGSLEKPADQLRAVAALEALIKPVILLLTIMVMSKRPDASTP